jgi:hypothetical protein
MITDKGYAFEDEVEAALRNLESEFPERVKVTPQKQFSNASRPHSADFELQYRLGGLTQQHLIECQNRARSSQEIADKIYSVRGTSEINRDILVYKDGGYLSRKVEKRLKEMGVLYFDMDHFEFEFLAQLGADLALNELGQLALQNNLSEKADSQDARVEQLRTRASTSNSSSYNNVDRAQVSTRPAAPNLDHLFRRL